MLTPAIPLRLTRLSILRLLPRCCPLSASCAGVLSLRTSVVRTPRVTLGTGIELCDCATDILRPDLLNLQQDAYNEIDAACSAERQVYVFDKVYTILKTPMKFSEKDVARTFFLKLTQSTKDWNRVKFDSQEFKDLEQSIFASVKEVSANA